MPFTTIGRLVRGLRFQKMALITVAVPPVSTYNPAGPPPSAMFETISQSRIVAAQFATYTEPSACPSERRFPVMTHRSITMSVPPRMSTTAGPTRVLRWQFVTQSSRRTMFAAAIWIGAAAPRASWKRKPSIVTSGFTPSMIRSFSLSCCHSVG